MNILYYECFAGISGDMNLGAMIDLGVDIDYLIENLSKLKIDNEFEITIEKKAKMGICGTKVNVILKHENKSNENHHNSRGYYDIERIINNSDLSEKVKKLSRDIFMKLAIAEGNVHGKTIGEVHFHEVGATDSIIDIVGTAICYEKLGIEKVYCSDIELGSGFVLCEHGKIHIPAPATVEILKGIPTIRGSVKGEATTPTGAAIISTLCQNFSCNIKMTTTKIGYGLGTRDFEIPNVLRVSIGKIEENIENDYIREKQYMIETNIDDMNQEMLPLLEEELFLSGVLDVFKTPVIMKKGRVGTKLSILVVEKNKESVIEILFRKTSTLGVRIYAVDKVMLRRNFIDLETKYGTVTVKEALLNGQKIKYKPEFEQLKEISKKNNISILDVQDEVLYEYRKTR